MKGGGKSCDVGRDAGDRTSSDDIVDEVTFLGIEGGRRDDCLGGPPIVESARHAIHSFTELNSHVSLERRRLHDREGIRTGSPALVVFCANVVAPKSKVLAMIV